MIYIKERIKLNLNFYSISRTKVYESEI